VAGRKIQQGLLWKWMYSHKF